MIYPLVKNNNFVIPCYMIDPDTEKKVKKICVMYDTGRRHYVRILSSGDTLKGF